MSSTLQSGDVLITSDVVASNVEFGIAIVNGTMRMTQGFETALVLSLFGGNELDSGKPGSPETWWGNLLENEPQFKLVSRTQNLLRSLPATSGNLRLIEDAVRTDLQWFIDTGIASGVEDVLATIPGVNRVSISGRIVAIGQETDFSFTANWKAAV